MPTFNDYGIVLHSYKLSESGKILNIYTKDHGLIKAVYKSTKTAKSSFRGKFDQLSCCYFQFAIGKSLYTICECEQINSFSLLRSNLVNLSAGILFLEIINSFSHEGEIDSIHTYNLLYSSLDKLQTNNEPDLLIVDFMIEFLSIHGYKPQLETCVSCSTVISWDRDVARNVSTAQSSIPYSSILGGLLCIACSETLDHKMVHSETLELLQLLTTNSKSSNIETLHSPTFEAKGNIRSVLKLLREHLDLRAKNKIKSFDLLLSL